MTYQLYLYFLRLRQTFMKTVCEIELHTRTALLKRIDQGAGTTCILISPRVRTNNMWLANGHILALVNFDTIQEYT